MTAWYSDRNFPEIKSGNDCIIAVVEDLNQREALITDHNEREAALAELERKYGALRKTLSDIAYAFVLTEEAILIMKKMAKVALEKGEL